MTLVEWQTAAVGAAGFAFLALVVAVVAAGYARGSRDATNRQATAAEAQVEIMRRQVDLMERQGRSRGSTAGARLAEGPGRQPASPSADSTSRG